MADKKATRPPAHRAPLAAQPDLATVKQWIIQGELDAARKSLQRRLAKSPQDIAALQLLALVQNKEGDAKSAVQTYKRIIDVGSVSEKNRARFRSGVIFQDRLGRHEAAISMFDGYLREAGDRRANAAEARMRLAKSVKLTGDRERYKAILKRVVKEHGGSEAAEKAGRELERLGRQ